MQLTVWRICCSISFVSSSKCSTKLKSMRSIDVSKRSLLRPIFVNNYPISASIYTYLLPRRFVTPSGEAGQWGPRPSHCGRWHWTVMAHLSPVWFRVVLGQPHGQLDWLSYVPIRGLPLELRCPVAMTSILLLVISGDFYLQYYTVWDWFCMDWDCLLVSSLVTIRFGTAFYFPFWVLYGLGLPSAFRSEYYTNFGLPSL